MLKIEKKIKAELVRLEKQLYYLAKPVEGWSAKKCCYKAPGTYEKWEEKEFFPEEGEHFGKPGETVFLKNKILLDESYCGKAAVLLLKIGGEACVLVNGKHYNGLDYNRNMILLTKCAKGNEEYEIEIEAYCKDLIMDSGNVFKTGLNITQSQLATIRQAVWDYYFDVKTGFDFISECREEYTKQRVMHLIYDSLLKLDYSGEELSDESLVTALEVYRKEIGRYKDLKLPLKMYFAGHSHIDIAWHWPLKETVRKTSRTFSSMLRLMEQYKDFKFSQSMPVLYEMAKEHYPEVYEQIKARIKEGRWETLGSMYLEPDCNLISGESFVRQILYGKKFYNSEFGSDSNICFLPDVFGYSSAMPQILKKAGTDYFFTTKLTWNETNEFPYSVFRWRGLDGTEILSGMMSMCTQNGLGLYNGDLSAHGVNLSLDHFKNKGNGDPLLYLYGHGDGGGGVTKEMLETLISLDKVPFTPKVEISTVAKYFEDLDKDKEYPVWSGELYFEKHRGTYTTAAKNKKNNRKSEFLFRDAEIFSIFQYINSGVYQGEDLEYGWKKILLNQFHDILPGTCIKEVYEECDRQYEEISSIGESSIELNTGSLVSKDEACITVFNTLSWSRTQIAVINGRGRKAVKDGEGRYPKQVLNEDGTIEFLAEAVPAMGYKVYYLDEEQRETEAVFLSDGSQEDNIKLTNDWFDITVNRDGEFTSLYDKKAGREVLKTGRKGNLLKLLEDIPVEWGAAWETTTKREDKPPMEAVTKSLTIKESNCLYTVVQMEKQIHNSVIQQDIILYRHSPVIQFKTKVDWQEHQKMLRVEFPAEINSLTARYDVAFGNCEHPNHATTSYDEAKFEVCGHKWGDVSEGGYGVSLLNDCKYGYTIRNSNMELSLLKSADFPSESCDRGVHTFSYWLYPHTGSIKEGRVAQTGYEVNIPFTIREGKAPQDWKSFIQTDCDNVIIDTVKKAEMDNSIIVRIFETYNTASDVTVRFSFPVRACRETDMLERDIEEVPLTEGAIRFRINPFEIKTFKLICS